MHIKMKQHTIEVANYKLLCHRQLGNEINGIKWSQVCGFNIQDYNCE